MTPRARCQPAACETYEVSDDQLTYTFHLRDGIKWSNGEDVTANDFIYAWHRNAQGTGTAAQFQYQIEMAALKNYAAVMAGEMDINELGCKAIDDKTIEITLEHPVPFLAEPPGLHPVGAGQPEVLRGAGRPVRRGQGTTCSYSGAYILDAFSTDSNTITLKKNPDYWGADSVGRGHR